MLIQLSLTEASLKAVGGKDKLLANIPKGSGLVVRPASKEDSFPGPQVKAWFEAIRDGKEVPVLTDGDRRARREAALQGIVDRRARAMAAKEKAKHASEEDSLNS